MDEIEQFLEQLEHGNQSVTDGQTDRGTSKSSRCDIAFSGDIMTSTFFLGRISKIGDGYCLRVGFLHIHGKFHEDPMKTLGYETKNVKK